MAMFVVIPVYNEVPEILYRLIDQFPPQYFLVIVDDGSAQTYQVNRSNAVLLKQAVNQGQGAAIRQGIAYALNNGAEYIATFDADGQHRLVDLQKMEELIQQKNYDVILGSRFHSPNKGMPFIKKLVLKGGVLLQNKVFGMRLTDAHNGLRVFNRYAAQKIKITENRMAHASDIIYQVKLHKLTWFEMPMQVEYSPYAVKKGQSVFNSFAIFFLIFKIRFRKHPGS